jgi:hypothetical protein
MCRIVLLVCLIVAVSPAWAADTTVATTATAATAGPNADSTPLQTGAGQPATALQSANCPARPALAEGAPSAILVALDPDTLWRPRGSEVRFTISQPGGTVGVASVRVCFGWSSPDGEFRQTQVLMGSPQVRSVSNDGGLVEYGAVVPVLRRVPAGNWWPLRLFTSTNYTYTGGFTVPVADMVVEVNTTSGQKFVSAIQVGITNVSLAWAVVVGVLALIWLIMDRITRHRGIRGSTLLLRVISTRDGYASLSQLQIVLWTLVVAMSAIYVMTLSGNLISISEGTLILLGIASGAALAARLPGSGPSAPVQPVPGTPRAMPEWSDLVVPDRSKQDIDVTRLQMLTFTLITAGFVLIKVVVDYEIPAIPANFLVLMGISNGVYVGGLKLPSQPKNGGVAPEA